MRTLIVSAGILLGMKKRRELKYELRRLYIFITRKSIFARNLSKNEENIQ